MVADFAAAEVQPQAAAHDASGTLNLPLLRRLGELGLLGVTVPAEVGGAGLDATAAVIAHHELAKYDPGFTLAYLAHSILFVNNLYLSGSADHHARFLPKTLSGEWVGAMGMTEPGAGTDVLGMTTTAVLSEDGSHYKLSGSKTYITNAVDATVFIVYAKVNGRVTSFVLERGMPGFTTAERHIDKCGMRSSTMAELFFDGARVPVANRLGAEGGGVRNMMRNLELERLTLAAMSIGIADRCVTEMTRWANQRQAFGQPLRNFGQIQRYIAESYAETEAAKALVYSVAGTVGHDRENRIGTDAAKLFAAPVGKRAADNAMQVLGGLGYCRETGIERLWRDAKLLEIGGGTLEAHHKNIVKDLCKNL